MSDERTAPRYSVSAVAGRLGIAPATLRTWDRRYGLGPQVHASGSHRRYAPEDLARLEAMQCLVLQGVPPGEAARVVLEGGPPSESPRRPGGRVLPLPGAEDVVRGLGRAAMALDSGAVLECLTEQLDRHGVVATWERVMVPVLVSVGERWAATGEGVEVEHLLADCVATALRRHTRPVHATRAVLLACAPHEQHALPLLVLAAALAERGQAARVLGAAVPPEALLAAVRRTGPAAVFVWSQRAATGRRELDRKSVV